MTRSATPAPTARSTAGPMHQASTTDHAAGRPVRGAGLPALLMSALALLLQVAGLWLAIAKGAFETSPTLALLLVAVSLFFWVRMAVLGLAAADPLTPPHPSAAVGGERGSR